MNTRLRVLSTLGALAIVVGACSSGGQRRPPAGSDRRRPRQPAAAAGGAAGGGASRARSTSGIRTARARAPRRPLSRRVTDKIKAANPDLKLDDPGRQVRRPVQEVRARGRQRRRARTSSSPRTTASARRPARACSSTSRSMLEGKLGNDCAASGRRQQGRRQALHGPRVPQGRGDVLRQVARSRRRPRRPTSCSQAVKDGTIKAGFDAHSSYHSFGWWAAFGGKLMDDTGKCVADTTGVADAYKYFQDLQTAGAKWYDKYDDLASDFKAGKIDLIVDGPWASGGYKEALKDNLAVAPMPAGPKGPSQPLTGVDGWYINTNAQEPGARGQLRPRDGQGRERAGLRRHRRPHPGRQDDQDRRSDHPEVRRGRRDRLPAAAGARSSTTSGATSTTP